MTERAAIDVGSNAARLLIEDGGQPILRRSHLTGLSADLGRNGRLSPDGLARTAAVLAAYRTVIEDRRAVLVRVVGTASARTADNGDELAALVAEAVGRPLEVLSPHAEARLTFLGAAGRGRRLVVDIGGGSTELIVGDGEPEAAVSIALGSTTLTGAELPSDPPRAEELSNAIAIAHDEVEEALRALPAVDELTPIVGTGGTITTVAAVEIGLPVPGGPHGDGDRDVDDPVLHGFTLSRPAAEDVFRTLAGEALADRVHNPGLPRRRAPVIVGGCCLLVALLRRLQAPGLTVSVTDLLDGALREPP